MKRFTGIVFVGLGCFAAFAQNLPQLGVTLDPQGLPVLSWQAKSNWFYRVEVATNLKSAPWTIMAVSNLQVVASNGLISTKILARVPLLQFYRVRATAIRPFGVMSLSPKFSTAPGDLNDLGASWARFNVFLDGNDKPFTQLLDAGINLVVTFQNRDPANVSTNYGSLLTYSKAGFPFLVESNYQQDIRAYLAPAEPYLALGQQVWVQCENEVDDVTHDTNSLYWCGTTAQYLSDNLAALYQTAHSMKPPLPVVLTSFASEKLDQVSVPPINTGSPAYIWQTNFFLTLLSQGTYDSADLHFYGYATNIQSKIQWLKKYLPPSKPWISTENGGPDSRVSPFISWTNTVLFENTESNEVPVRLDACLTNSATITMWFSLYDFLPDTNTIFGHLGLMLPSGGTDFPKPAYYSFKNYTAAH